jgi:hypothetical protein
LVEQRTENPRVVGSIPTLATTPNLLILMPLSPRQGGHRASMAGTIGLPGIWSVGHCYPSPSLTAIGLCGSHSAMRSKLADQARQSLNEDLRRMTPEERLAAYVRHCQLMAQVREAGQAAERSAKQQPTPDAH